MIPFNERLKNFSLEFNSYLTTLFNYPQGTERQVSEAMYYSLINGGKRLRPFLVCQTAKLFNVPETISFPVAASLGASCIFTGAGRLPERPNVVLTDAQGVEAPRQPEQHEQHDEHDEHDGDADSQ